jgi:hypothetical protein
MPAAGPRFRTAGPRFRAGDLPRRAVVSRGPAEDHQRSLWARPEGSAQRRAAEPRAEGCRAHQRSGLRLAVSQPRHHAATSLGRPAAFWRRRVCVRQPESARTWIAAPPHERDAHCCSLDRPPWLLVDRTHGAIVAWDGVIKNVASWFLCPKSCLRFAPEFGMGYLGVREERACAIAHARWVPWCSELSGGYAVEGVRFFASGVGCEESLRWRWRW